FFFQAEDGIRDWSVTGVQTCALPISAQPLGGLQDAARPLGRTHRDDVDAARLGRRRSPGDARDSVWRITRALEQGLRLQVAALRRARRRRAFARAIAISRIASARKSHPAKASSRAGLARTA